MCIFSVIVPVFNTKVEYLERCIASVCSQKENNYELIIINDGSTEKYTYNFLENLVSLNNDKIKIFNQNNKGVSSARNLGIEKSKGEYILFLDADDFLHSDCIYNLNAVIKSKKYDILFFKFKNYFSSTRELEEVEDNNSIYMVESIESIIKEIINPNIRKKNFNYGTPWAKIIKRDLLIKYGIKFEADLPRTQDRVFMFDCCKNANKIGILNYTGYIYNSNIDSVCSKYNYNLFQKLMRVYSKFLLRQNEVLFDISEDLKCLKTNFFFETLASDIFHKDNKKKLYHKITEANKIYIENYYDLFKENGILKFTSFKRKLFIYLFRYRLGFLVYFIYYIKSRV